MPCQRCAGWGGRHRLSPVGAAAYGIPRNWRTSLTSMPFTNPLSVTATGESGREAAELLVMVPATIVAVAAAMSAARRAQEARLRTDKSVSFRLAASVPRREEPERILRFLNETSCSRDWFDPREPPGGAAEASEMRPGGVAPTVPIRCTGRREAHSHD